MAQYWLSDRASLDLLDIEDYVSRGSPSHAERVIEDLLDAMSRLAEMPLMGHARPEVISGDVRFWTVHSYLIAYRARTQPIQILRVISGFRDLIEVLPPR